MYIKGQTLPNSNCCLRCPTVLPSRQTNIHRMTSLTITISATSLTPAPSPSLPKTAKWTATYTVKVVPAEMPETFHFEDLLPSAGTEYDIFYEFNPELQPVFHA